ncbi:MAG: histidine kinase [Bacteroidia bacterium]|nr:histidine kinase [Bacteroidia bacterium]
MRKIFIHNPFFRICAPLLFGVLVYLLILLVNNDLNQIGKIFNNGELYVCIVLSYLSLESLRLTIVVFSMQLTKDIAYQKKIITQIIVSAIVSMAAVAAGVASYFYWIAGFTVGMAELQIFLWIFGITALLYNLLYFSNEYLLKENTIKVEEEKHLRDKLEAEFVAFKNEINPDLLYESLETLVQTLHHRIDAAEDQIDFLAGIYRYQLIHRNQELVTLREELRILDLLLQLLNHKHRNLIKLNKDISAEDDFYLIPGSLLISLDTIVRNTLIGDKSPLTVRLYIEEDGYLVLQHKMNDRLIAHENSLQAFVHLQRAYLFFSDRPFVQVKAELENYIKFPLMNVAEENSISQEV